VEIWRYGDVVFGIIFTIIDIITIMLLPPSSSSSSSLRVDELVRSVYKYLFLL